MVIVYVKGAEDYRDILRIGIGGYLMPVRSFVNRYAYSYTLWTDV
jgi:hypothetical protein